jgi:hypothetical protein
VFVIVRPDEVNDPEWGKKHSTFLAQTFEFRKRIESFD